MRVEPWGADDRGSELELRREDGLSRHYLIGRPVRQGDRLELALADGGWLPGIYEWRRDGGSDARWPMLRIDLGGPWEHDGSRRPSGVITLAPQARLRWRR